MAAERISRAQQGADTRERILAAARRVLADEGLDRFTTRRVADLAKVSHGMVHYHFDDKRALLLALLVHGRRDWIEPLEELVDGPGTAQARMKAVIDWVAQPATREAMHVHTAVLVHALGDDALRERLASEYARWREPFVTLFRELGEELGVEGLDARSVGGAFASAADGLVQQMALDPELPTAKMLTRLYERSLGLPPSRSRPSGPRSSRSRS